MHTATKILHNNVLFDDNENITIIELFNKDRKTYNKIMCNSSVGKQYIHNYKKTLENNFIKNGKYNIGKLGFNTKKQLKCFISEWLKYSYDGYIPDNDSSLWIQDVFKQHKSYAEKSKNFSHFIIRFDMNNYHFSVVHTDNTETDFSYLKSLNNVSKLTDIKKAFRFSIIEQIQSFKKQHFKGICDITGKTLQMSDCHVDHNFNILTFDQLLNNFCKKHNVKLDKVHLTDCGTYKIITDKNIDLLWKHYHSKHSVLRCIDKTLNLSGKMLLKK